MGVDLKEEGVNRKTVIAFGICPARHWMIAVVYLGLCDLRNEPDARAAFNRQRPVQESLPRVSILRAAQFVLVDPIVPVTHHLRHFWGSNVRNLFILVKHLQAKLANHRLRDQWQELRSLKSDAEAPR